MSQNQSPQYKACSTRAMYLVMSCGSNSFPSYVVKLLYIWPLESFTFNLQMCRSALGVLSDQMPLLFSFLFTKKKRKTPETSIITSCLMASVKLEIFVFSHTL